MAFTRDAVAAALGGNEFVAWRSTRPPTHHLGQREGAFATAGAGTAGVSERCTARSIRQPPYLKLPFIRAFVFWIRLLHVLTAMTIPDPANVHVVDPASLPKIPNWLSREFPAPDSKPRRQLLNAHKCVAIPSAVSVHS